MKISIENFPIICPVCGEKLNLCESSYKCKKGHCFDIAKSGYVNLLPPSPAGRHGDDCLMVKAREAFLKKGYYDPLINAVTLAVNNYSRSEPVIIDAGCGEGTYTESVCRGLDETGKKAKIIGVDISKNALKSASRRCVKTVFIAASTASMPISDNSADLIMNIFSPLFCDEFRRILKYEGILLRVVPLENHLFELKDLVYDRPYRNEAPIRRIDGFKFVCSRELKYKLKLEDNDDISNLFMMTPYYYKTSEADRKKASDISSLNVSVEFLIMIFKKQDQL